MKNWTDMTKDELLALPHREWNRVSTYRSVLFVNTNNRHDSGYNLFVIIGRLVDGTMEIAGHMDDFRMFPVGCSVAHGGVAPTFGFAFDCSMHGVFRLHSDSYYIGVGACGSTTDLFFIPINDTKAAA